MGGKKRASGRTDGKAVNDSPTRDTSSKGRSESKPGVREKRAKPGNGRTTSSRGQCLVRAIALRALGFVKKHAKKFSVATLMAIVATGYPIWQDWTNVPKFEMRLIDMQQTLEFTTREGSYAKAYVITNQGKHEGTILSIRQRTGDEMKVCVPRMDADGTIHLENTEDRPSVEMLGHRHITLEPMQSQLVFFVSPPGQARLVQLEDGAGLIYTTPVSDERFLALQPDGKTTELDTTDFSEEYADHFISLPGFDEAKQICLEMAAEDAVNE